MEQPDFGTGAASTGSDQGFDALSVYELRYLVWHVLENGQCDLADRLLTNWDFLAAKAMARMIDGVLRDYQLLERAQTGDGSPLTHAFSRFIAHQAHFLREAPAMLLQQAINSEEEALSGRAKEAFLSPRWMRPWLRKTTGQVRPQHSGQVISLAFWHGAEELVCATTSREVWVWDLSRAKLDRRCEAPPSAAKSISISPNGSYLAAAFGAAEPTPLDAGVIVWDARGASHRCFALGDDWGYHVRWIDDDKLIVGAGLPHGSEANGSLWRLGLAESRSEEIERSLSDRPIVFSWHHGDDVMTLDLAGRVCRIRPAFTPISQDEIEQIPVPVGADGLDWKAWPASVDAFVEARRPTVGKISAPASGTFGFSAAVSRLDEAKICLIGAPAVPPEMFAWHTPAPDGVYMYDAKDDSGGVFRFSPDALEAGLRALCVGASPDGTSMAVGFNDGNVAILPSGPSNLPRTFVARQPFPVTAVALSDDPRLLALGGDRGQVLVLDLVHGTTLFSAGSDRRPYAVRIVGERVLRVEASRLVLSRLNTSDACTAIELPRGTVGLEVDMADDRCAIVIATTGESAPDFEVQWVDLAKGCLGDRWSVPSERVMPLAVGESSVKVPRLRLRSTGGETSLLLGSDQSFSEFTQRGKRKGHRFAADPMHKGSERQISVMRMGLQPRSLEVFEPAPDGRFTFAGYADNEDHPRVSGFVIAWNHETGESTPELRLPARVAALAVSANDVVVVGSDDGRASVWRWLGSWHSLSEQQHRAEIVAVAIARHEPLACSVSRDGHIRVWSYAESAISNFHTFIDVEPAAVGFFDDGRALAIVDRSGEVHTWEIREGEHER
jgi:WD40 repeat protein